MNKDGNITEVLTFESGHSDIELNPYGDKCPVTVGSNQKVINWETQGPIYETECSFCGNYGICREYFKINFSEEIMDAFGYDHPTVGRMPMGRYGNPLCINTCYKKLDRLMHTKHGSF